MRPLRPELAEHAKRSLPLGGVVTTTDAMKELLKDPVVFVALRVHALTEQQQKREQEENGKRPDPPEPVPGRTPS